MGEYIEREAALNIVNGWRDQLIPTYGNNDEYVKCLETVAEHLESLHAANVRPVVRAKWTDHRTIEHDGEWYCTACGKEITIYMGADRKDRYNFCPNCGADMREEN